MGCGNRGLPKSTGYGGNREFTKISSLGKSAMLQIKLDCEIAMVTVTVDLPGGRCELTEVAMSCGKSLTQEDRRVQKSRYCCESHHLSQSRYWKSRVEMHY